MKNFGSEICMMPLPKTPKFYCNLLSVRRFLIQGHSSEPIQDLEENLKRREMNRRLISFGDELDFLDSKNGSIPNHLRKISPQKRYDENCKFVRKSQIQLIEKNKNLHAGVSKAQNCCFMDRSEIL